MADAIRELRLKITYDAESATSASKAFHDAEKRQIKETADEQRREEDAYIKAVKLKLKAEADFAKEILRRIKEREAAEKQLEQERIRGAKATAKAQADAAKEANALLKQLAKDEADAAKAKVKGINEARKAAADASREANALLKQLARDEEKFNRQVASEKKKADKDAFSQWKLGFDAQHRLAMANWRDQQEAIKANTDEVAGLIKTYAGISAIRGAAQAIGDEFKRANEYVERVGKEFADVRTAMIQVAALRDKTPTDKFTMEQVDQSYRARLVPEQWAKAQEAFLNPAADQIGDQPGTKMTDAQAQEYEMRVARVTAAKLGGDNAGLGMEFAGTILRQSKDRLTPEQAMAQFNPGFEALQKGPIDLRRAMPMMSQVMAHGTTAAQAATLLNVVQPAAPGEEATHVEAAMRAIEKMRVEGKGKPFGVDDKMSQYDAIKAFSENVAGRKKALRAKGKTEEEAEVEIARQLKEAGVATRIEEQRGLIRGMVRQGVELGGFKRYEDIAAKTAPDADLAAVEEFEGTEEGQAAKRRSAKATATARAGKKQQPVKAVLEDADNEAIREGAYERGRADFLYRGTVGMATGVSAEDQVRNEIAVGTLRRKAYYSHHIAQDAHAHFQEDEKTGIDVKDVQYRTQQSVNDEIRDLLKLLVDAEKEKARQRNPPQPMVNAQPANPRGR